MQYALRTSLARIIHTIIFELFIVVLLTPIISNITNKPSNITGGLALVIFFWVMISNYFFNLAFDQQLLRLEQPVYKRSFGLRVVHALLFEAILLLFAVPATIFMINFSFWEALKLGVTVAPLVVTITIIYNKVFDWCLEN